MAIIFDHTYRKDSSIPPANSYPDYVVCEHCDSVYKRRPGASGEDIRCATCDALLHRNGHVDLDAWLALTVAAAIVFTIANLAPVLRLSLEQMHTQATLWQAMLALARGPGAPIAVPLGLSIIVVPALQIGLLGWALAYAWLGRRAPGFAPIMRMLVALRPWNMVEVGLIGILVTSIKLSSYLKVIPGIGLWAMGASIVLFTLIVKRDIRGLWEVTEASPAVRETA